MPETANFTTAKRRDYVIPGIFGIGFALIVYIAALIGENHFRLLDGLCNRATPAAPLSKPNQGDAKLSAPRSAS